MRNLFITLLIILLPPTGGFAQKINKDQLLERTAYFIKAIGPMEDYSLTDIIDTFRSQKYDEIEMAYAIYSWVALNIKFDSRAFHHRNQANLTASAALTERKAISEGYAGLFKAMCDIARIECVIISGLAKAHPETIGKVNERNSHTWNALKIKNTWYYADAAWGAGTTDKNYREFKKGFTDAWIFTNRQLFLLSHYPADKKWQLTDEPINKSLFSNAPTVSPISIVCEVYPGPGLRGRIRGKENDCKRVVFQLGKPEAIRKVDIAIREHMIPAEYYIQGNKLSVDIPFPARGNYPVRIYINDSPAYGFIAEVSKSGSRNN